MTLIPFTHNRHNIIPAAARGIIIVRLAKMTRLGLSMILNGIKSMHATPFSEGIFVIPDYVGKIPPRPRRLIVSVASPERSSRRSTIASISEPHMHVRDARSSCAVGKAAL